MIKFIVLFFPAIISLYIVKNRTKKSYKDLLFDYPIYNIIINMIVMLIVCFYKRGQIIIINENFNILGFCIKYLLIASFVAIIIPYFIEFVKKNFNAKIEIRRDKKKYEKSNKK